jgi:hypothetical protein
MAKVAVFAIIEIERGGAWRGSRESSLDATLEPGIS